MTKRWLIVLMALLPMAAMTQEMLVPAAAGHRVPPRKQQAAAVRLPFFDDFSDYSGALDSRLWDTGGVSVGTGYGTLPPTVGMMTLDALDADGRLYPQAATSLFPADTAMSLPIRLDSLSPTDSVVLSFYYLPSGGKGNLWERVGDAPDGRDSLFLDFYFARDSVWRTVWSRGGVSEDTLIAHTGRSWQYVSVALTDSGCFDSLFRFRFRNYCSLEDNGKPGIVSNSDQWNIDYVLLDRGRVASATPEFRDVAFVAPAPSMLSHYRAMPARQYRQNEMAQTLGMTIGNLYSSDLASQYTYTVLSDDSTVIHTSDGGYENAPAFLPGGTYQTAAAHATPRVAFSFDEGAQARRYTVAHTVREGTSGDWRQQNDTVRYEQVFDNYYAYDDGSAENGYGLTSTASRVYLAYRFDLNEADTLTAVDLCFNQTLGEVNEMVQFMLTVWNAEEGKPGTVLYRDEARRRPVTGGYQHYALERPTIVSGSIFVGFEQVGNDFINLGFDRSFNTADRIYYLTSTQWQQSILSGSLMLRPCFGESGLQGIVRQATAMDLAVSPNPATDRVQVNGLVPGSEVTLYDMQGRRLFSACADAAGCLQLTVGTMANGLCLLRAVSPEGTVGTAKIIIRH